MDVTIINKPLPFPTKQIEMSVDEWVASSAQRRSRRVEARHNRHVNWLRGLASNIRMQLGSSRVDLICCPGCLDG